MPNPTGNHVLAVIVDCQHVPEGADNHSAYSVTVS